MCINVYVCVIISCILSYIFSDESYTKENLFFIEGHIIIPLFDYVHLQKGVRNNLLNKNLIINKNKTKYANQYASWDAIQKLYEIDKHTLFPVRNLRKLIDKHIYPAFIPKMRVKYAVQVMSHTVASYMYNVMSNNQGKVY